jgi:acyl carrier protein
MASFGGSLPLHDPGWIITRMDTTRDQVTAIVAKMLARRSVSTPVDEATDLRDSGLTSLDMVSLMLAVECEFDIEIPRGEMTPQNFRSIGAIEALVGRLVVAVAA